MQLSGAEATRSTACSLGIGLETGGNPTSGLHSTHTRSSNGSRHFHNGCRKARRPGEVDRRRQASGQARGGPHGHQAPEPGLGGAAAGLGHTDGRLSRRAPACVITEPLPRLRSCKGGASWRIPGKTSNSSSGSKTTCHRGELVLKITRFFSILSPQDTFKSNPALPPYELPWSSAFKLPQMQRRLLPAPPAKGGEPGCARRSRRPERGLSPRGPER